MSTNQPPPPPPPPPGGGAASVPAGGWSQPASGGNNQKAIIALVTGIASLLCCPLIGIASIILGRQSQQEIARTGEQGEGMAKAGFILGIIALVLAVLGTLSWVLLIAASSTTT